MIDNEQVNPYMNMTRCCNKCILCLICRNKSSVLKWQIAQKRNDVLIAMWCTSPSKNQRDAVKQNIEQTSTKYLSTTRGVPKRSPIQVLTTPDVAWLRWSDENRYFQRGMAVDNNAPSWRLIWYDDTTFTTIHISLPQTWNIEILQHS